MEKHTKTKADIKSILEKYNLKPSKQTKTNIQPTNFEIKPNINQSNVIHISKSAPNTPTNPPLIPISPQPVLNRVHSGGQSKSLNNTPTPTPTPIPTPIKQINLQSANNTNNKNNNNNNNNNNNSIVKPVLDVKNLIDNDKQKELARKQEMPKAIISPGRGTNKGINIYDFIPTVKTPLPIEKHRQQNNTADTIVMNGGNNLTIKPKQPEYKQPEYKQITINPNLSEEDSQNYKGDYSSSVKPTKAINLKEIINQTQQDTKPLNKIHSRTTTRTTTSTPNSTPTSINTPTLSTNASISNSGKLVVPVNQDIKGNSGGKKSKSVSFGLDKLDNGEITELEKQKILLQKQQMLELQRFKAKKAEIIKINNRKKEIELMRSIEDEKNKLRRIQEKQHELNNIYNQQLRQQHSSNTQNLTIKSILYDVDAKRTKKNIPNPSVIDVPVSSSQPKQTTPTPPPTTPQTHPKKAKFQEPTNQSLINANKKILTTKSHPTSSGDGTVVDSTVVDSSGGGGVNNAVNVEKKKELKIGEPLKYYTKKDKTDIKWPAKSDLYNTETFTETLTTILGAPAVFNKKQIKDKASVEDIHKALIDVYGFKHINKFKDTLLITIYKILSYEKIKWLLE